MTGWRLGWVWPQHLIDHVNKLLINSVSCVNVAQLVGIAALDGPDDSINAMMEKFTQRRDLIYKGLNDLPGVECSLPGGAFYALPKVIGTGMNGAEFVRKVMHEAGENSSISFGELAKIMLISFAIEIIFHELLKISKNAEIVLIVFQEY